MEIKGSTPEGIDITVEFLKPFHAINQTRLSFEPSGSGTEVRWVMTGEHKGLMGVFGTDDEHGQVDREGLREGPGPAQGCGRGERRTFELTRSVRRQSRCRRR